MASNDNVRLEQNGLKVKAVGLKLGETKVSVFDSSKKLTKEVTLKVVDVVAPSTYEISVSNSTIEVGNPETIKFDIDAGESIGKDELLLSRYYDLTKLTYTSSDEETATVDKFGVIHPLDEGNTTIKVSNDLGFEKTLDIKVTGDTLPVNYENLRVECNDYCYENEVFENPKNYSFNTFKIYDGDTKLSAKDFTYESSNELLVKVDKSGVIRGYRKLSKEDEKATITITSKKTGQSLTKEITVKRELPDALFTRIDISGTQVWNQEKLTSFVGEIVTIEALSNLKDYENLVDVVASNPEVVNVTVSGNKVTLEFLKEGTTDVTLTSKLVPSLSTKISFTVMKAGAVQDYESFNLSLRKSLGHALMFALTQVFTYIALYMFFYDKKFWLISLISFLSGLVLASISETIQFFIPLRSGTIADVGIDMLGVIVGFVFVFSAIMIAKSVKRYKNMQKAHNKQEE